MTSPATQERGPFREWAPLTTILQKIPAKIQVGLFFQDINFTCIDAAAEFLAVGTNFGLVYWINRRTEKLETLKSESASKITCVRIVSTVDFMVAVGDDAGVVTIFVIPKQHPDSLPESLKPKKEKQIERFNISGLHKSSVTTVEWSKNGMKLFSGDEDGLIILTEMDFNLHISKSIELLNEKYSVVQLSYQSGLLLVSTLFRTIIVDLNRNNQVTQVGQKERKMLGKLGAVFSKNKNLLRGPTIFASRPGLRIWQADKNGTVMETLIFKDAINAGSVRVELINPATGNFKRRSRGEISFGVIKTFSDDLLITYNEEFVYFINPDSISVPSIVTDLRKITDVTCSDDEVFILEGDRNILRVAAHPDVLTPDSAIGEFTDFLAAFTDPSKSLPRGIAELTSKLKSNPITSTLSFPKIKPLNLIPAASYLSPIINGIDTTSVISAEEAVEMPPVYPLDVDTPLVTSIDSVKGLKDHSMHNGIKKDDRKDIFRKIAEQDFEDVVYTPRKDNKSSARKEAKISQVRESENKENDDQNIKIERNGATNALENFEEEFVKDRRKYLETIEKDVEDKEKLLSNYLSLDLSIYLDKPRSSENSKSCDSVDAANKGVNGIAQPFAPDTKYAEQKLESLQLGVVNPDKESGEDDCVNTSPNSRVEEKDERLDPIRPSVDEKKMLEINFHALSKEFVKSTIHDDGEDWVLLG